MRTAKTLIRLGGFPGWSEYSLGAHAVLLVLSWGAQMVKNRSIQIISWSVGESELKFTMRNLKKVCLFVWSELASYQQFFSHIKIHVYNLLGHITTVSGCDRELNAHFFLFYLYIFFFFYYDLKKGSFGRNEVTHNWIIIPDSVLLNGYGCCNTVHTQIFQCRNLQNSEQTHTSRGVVRRQ